jgi:hypothetical protein
MDYNHLSDTELLHYLSLYSTDPLVIRLVEMLSLTRGGIIGDLVDAGMDPRTWTFTEDYQEYYPGEYVTHLQKMAAYAEDERVVAEMDLTDMREKAERLSLRSVTELLDEAKQAISAAESNHRYAIRETEKAHEVIDKVQLENRDLKEKLGVWTIMSTP